MENSSWVIALGIALAGGLVALAIIRSRHQPIAQQSNQSFMNEETWEWVDYKGRERKITVHRIIRPISS